MKSNRFHSSFKLNGNSFESKDELLIYVTRLSTPIFEFLQDWFSEKNTLTVKTSGSTGAPKWIELEKKHMINSALATGNFFDLSKGTTALLCLPTEYIAGKMMLVRALVLGWHLDIVESSANPLKESNKIYDFSAMVPFQLRNSLEKIHLVKKLIVGGGLVGVDLEKEIQKVPTQIFATYGMTETITHIAVKKLNHLKWDHYKTFPEVTVSKDYRECLIINAFSVSNVKVITNDVVEIISETSFSWKGRYDNVINSGGIKLLPEEIERKLVTKIERKFFVTGIKDQVLGEKLVLIIEGKLYELPQDLYNDLTKYETPKEVFFVAKFIETETGKIQRSKTMKTFH